MDQRKLAASRAANRRKLIPLILAALFYQAVLAVLIYAGTGSPIGAIVGAVLPLFAIPVFYLMHDRVMTRGLPARPVAIPEDPELFAIAGRLSQVADIPAPAIYNISQTGINGFATGLHGQARLFLTEGMLDQLSPELDAALAQQLSHIATEDTRVDQLAFGLTGWILMPLTLLLRLVWGVESAMRTTAARVSNSGNGIGTFIAWPIYGLFAVFVIAAGIILALLTVPARLADIIVFRKREVNADAIAASMVSPRAMGNLLVLAAESPASVPSRVASKSALMDTRPREAWWRDPYVTRASADHRRKLLGAMPQPDPTTAVMLSPQQPAAAAYSPPAATNLGTVRSAEGLMLYQKVLYMIAGAILGVAGTAAAYMFVIDADDASTVLATPTPTVTATTTPRSIRTPTATPTRTPTGTSTPTVQTDFVVGQTVTLTNGSGNCLQTYTDPTFTSRKLRCEDDLTQKKITSGPFRVKDADGTFTWWGLEGGGYIIEKWIRK
jgi:Zn-dependent protease with chaperone function